MVSRFILYYLLKTIRRRFIFLLHVKDSGIKIYKAIFLHLLKTIGLRFILVGLLHVLKRLVRRFIILLKKIGTSILKRYFIT